MIFDLIKLIIYNIMSRLSNEQILSNIYYDLERGYGSAKSLFEQAKEEGAVITLEVKNFMKKQPNKQIKGYQKRDMV